MSSFRRSTFPRRSPRNWRITPPRFVARQRSASTDAVAFSTALGLALELNRPVEVSRMKPYANWTVYPDGSILTDSRNEDRITAINLAARFGPVHRA